MTRYRLPEALGGGEYEEYVHLDGGTEAPVGTVAFLEDGVLFCVGRGLLTEVKAPLPSEPPVGAFVHLASYFGVYERVDRGWISANEPSGGAAHEWEALRRLNSGDAPVRLLPEPFTGPVVALPWESHGVEVKQTTNGLGLGDHVFVSTKGASYGFAQVKPAEARDMARALWAAADAVEAKP